MSTQILTNMFLVAIGSGFGGASRYGLGKIVQDNVPTGFPLNTLSVNVLGCLILGIVYALLEKGTVMSDNMRLFLTAGFCGGFTTFSTFMYENHMLLSDNRGWWCIFYMLLSIAGGFLFLYLGYKLINSIF